MSRSVQHDFSHYSDRDLIEYGAACAAALNATHNPATRKRLHAQNAAILTLLAARLPQRPRMLPPPPARKEMVMVVSGRTTAPDGTTNPGHDTLVVE